MLRHINLIYNVADFATSVILYLLTSYISLFTTIYMLSNKHEDTLRKLTIQLYKLEYNPI